MAQINFTPVNYPDNISSKIFWKFNSILRREGGQKISGSKEGLNFVKSIHIRK